MATGKCAIRSFGCEFFDGISKCQGTCECDHRITVKDEDEIMNELANVTFADFEEQMPTDEDVILAQNFSLYERGLLQARDI